MMDANWLDWYDLFVNQVAGSMTIFIFLSIALIFYAGARYFRLPDIVNIGIIVLWCVLLSAVENNLLPSVLLFVAIFFGWALSKIFTRG